MLRFLETYVGKFEDPVMRMKILPYIIDKILVDGDNLAINIFFSGEKREENVEAIISKIRAYEQYKRAISGGRLEMSDEEYVRMFPGSIFSNDPEFQKKINQLERADQDGDASNFFG